MTKMSTRLFLFGLMLMCGRPVMAQKKTDTAELIKDFNRVMSFSVQPYLYYTSLTSLFSEPSVTATDTAILMHNRFYKLKDDLYYGNEQEETFLQDSLLIQISHVRKTIQLNKVDIASKAKLDVMPLQKTDIQKLLREHYTLSQSVENGDTIQLLIRQQSRPGLSDNMVVQLSYMRKTFLPLEMKMIVSAKQKATGEMISQLAAQGVNTDKMVENIGGEPYLVFSQTADTQFTDIKLSEEQAEQMPRWKEEVAYDGNQKTFTGKGICEGYEVIQAF